MQLQSWVQRRQYTALKDVLGTGVTVHLQVIIKRYCMCSAYMYFCRFFKVYMTRKIISAYLKGLSKHRRMVFFFLKYLFLF